MSRRRMQYSGLAGVAAGVLLVVAVLLGELVSDDFVFLLIPTLLLSLFALFGFQALQGEQAGLLGRIGFTLAAFGLALLAVGFVVFGALGRVFDIHPEQSEPIGAAISTTLLIVSFVSTITGLIAYGAATIRANVLPRLGGILFLAGLPLALVIDLATGAFGDETRTSYGLYIGFPLFAIGLAWLGYALWSQARSENGIDADEVQTVATVRD